MLKIHRWVPKKEGEREGEGRYRGVPQKAGGSPRKQGTLKLLVWRLLIGLLVETGVKPGEGNELLHPAGPPRSFQVSPLNFNPALTYSLGLLV